jgi:large repetitive protein
LPSRRLLVALTCLAAFAAVASASGAPVNAYTATVAPQFVKPSTATTYTISLTNDLQSPMEADRAKIGIPVGFAVSAPSVQASASATASCVASTWVADGTLIADGKINLKRPGGGGGGGRLCPGATLTVVFSATSSAAEGSYVWATELLRDATAYLLNGAQPTVAVDGTAPAVTLTSRPANPSNDGTPTFSFSANEAGATFECKLDDGAFAACGSPRTYDPGPGDGPHTFVVRATDAAGNTGTGASSAWTIDTVAPAATINAKPNDPSGVASAAFAFSASEPATFTCRLDSGSVGTCNSPKTYSNLPDGVHTFTLTPRDAAGNTGGEVVYSWLVETVLPVVTLTAQPSSPSTRPDASFSFTANKAATFECRLDASPFAQCTSPKDYVGRADGSHTFAVRAIGSAGTGPETVHTWSIDTVGPGSAITAKPGDPTNQRSAVFAFAANEQPATFQCKLDGGAFAACAPPQTYSNLPDGRHSFVVRAIDAASNIGSETVYEWTIENRAPAVVLTSLPRSLSNSSIASLVFLADEPATFQCKLDDRTFEPCNSPASYGGLGDGGHAVSVRAIDLAGNVGSASYSWTVDATPPETKIDSRPKARTTATSAVFTFSGGGSSRFECRLDSASFSRCASPRSYRRLAAGGHRFAVRAIDPAGNVDPTPSTAVWRVTKTGSSRTVASTALVAPAAGAHVTKPPLLRWRQARRATYYNVQLYRSGRKVLSTWPTRTKLQLQARWRFGGRTMQLSPGNYQWYVWPGYGRPSARNYGRLLGSSTFVVGRRVTRR